MTSKAKVVVGIPFADAESFAIYILEGLCFRHRSDSVFKRDVDGSLLTLNLDGVWVPSTVQQVSYKAYKSFSPCTVDTPPPWYLTIPKSGIVCLAITLIGNEPSLVTIKSYIKVQGEDLFFGNDSTAYIKARPIKRTELENLLQQGV